MSAEIKNVQSVNLSENFTWVNIVNARKREIDYLRKTYNFDLADLHDSFASISSLNPKVKYGSNYTFIVLHFPSYNAKTCLIESTEVDFFISPAFIVTVHYNVLPPLAGFFATTKKENGRNLRDGTATGIDIFFAIMATLLDYSYQLLDQNRRDADEVENIIFAGQSQKAANTILNLRRNIINFRKVMQTHKTSLRKFIRLNRLTLSESDTSAYAEVIEKTKDIWEILQDQKEFVEALYETNESLLSYRMTDIMKTLTIFSVIVFPLTLFAAIFGMNTVNGMPFVDREHGFWFIVGLMILASFGMLVFFKKKRWI